MTPRIIASEHERSDDEECVANLKRDKNFRLEHAQGTIKWGKKAKKETRRKEPIR